MPAVSKGSEVHFTPWINQMQPEKSGPCRPSSKLPQAPKQLQDSFLRQLCVAISRYANTLIGGRQGCFGTTPGDIRIELGIARDQVIGAQASFPPHRSGKCNLAQSRSARRKRSDASS